ncbi:YDG/SRA domain-containing protein [Pseudooceanicola sp. MF1-13]|uniref:YDG/SRA domain-containing protein n=1 Tax=Pseudooceanicola sp. MF1-13 TaxID=3379095 RepID=UPI00389152B4
MAIGEVEGAKVGEHFDSRRELYDAGVHRALQAGIVGRASVGAESIVLSGGYKDDEDHGSYIVYTGDGGRAPNATRQVADQEFTGKNQSLVQSCLEGLPVRVIREAGHESEHSPQTGYRFDGLFRVDEYWRSTGLDGFKVCRFRLVMLQNRSLELKEIDSSGPVADGTTRRVPTTVQRIVRDTALGRKVKELHDYTCQVCGFRLDCAGGAYAEAAHIRPLGAPHNGPDELANLLCLCPNHHILLDRGALSTGDDLRVSNTGNPLRLVRKHLLSLEHLRYQRSIWE